MASYTHEYHSTLPNGDQRKQKSDGSHHVNVNAGVSKDILYGLTDAEKERTDDNFWKLGECCGKHIYKTKGGERVVVSGCGKVFERRRNKFHHYYACDGSSKLKDKSDYHKKTKKTEKSEPVAETASNTSVLAKSSAEQQWELSFLYKGIPINFKELVQDSVSMDWIQLKDKYSPAFLESWHRGAFAAFCDTITVSMKKTTTVLVNDTSGLFSECHASTKTTTETYDISISKQVEALHGQSGIFNGTWEETSYDKEVDASSFAKPINQPVAWAVATPVLRQDTPSSDSGTLPYIVTIVSDKTPNPQYTRPIGTSHEVWNHRVNMSDEPEYDSDDEIDVSEIIINGIAYFLDDDGNIYDQKNQDEVGKSNNGVHTLFK
jgi:hypothetical protein